MARIIEFEGRRIELPDDATDAEVTQALGGATASAAPTTVPTVPGAMPAPPISQGDTQINWQQQTPVAPTSKRTFTQNLGIGAQGAARGLTELVATPFDLAAGAQNLLATGINKAFGTKLEMVTPASEMARNAGSALAEKVGIPLVDEANLSLKDQIGYNTNRFGAQAAGALPALVRAAATRAPQILEGGAKALPKWYDDLVRPYMGDSIGRTVAGDAVAAAGAGTAKSVVDQTEYKDSPLAQTLAVIAGGVGGKTAAGAGEAAARRVAAGVKRPFGGNIDASIPVDPETNMPVTKAISDAATAKVQSAAAYPPAESAARIVANTEKLRTLDPNVPLPPPAALAEDPGLANLERIASRQDPGGAMARNREFASGVRDTLDRSVPEGAQPQALVSRVQNVADARNNVAQRQVDQALGQRQGVKMARTAEAEASVQPYEGRGVPASQRLDKAIVNEGYLPARAEKNRLYNEGVPPETPVDISGAATAAEAVRQNVDQLPESLRGGAMREPLLKDMEASGPTTYGVAKQTRMALSEEGKKARTAGEFTKADNIREIRKPVEAEMNRVNPVAEQNYRENFAPTYRPGPGDEAATFTAAIDRDPTRSTTPPSATAGRFLQPGAPEKHQALARMIDAAANPRDGQTAAREYLLSDLAGAGVLDQQTGVIRPDRLRQWQKQWGNLDNVAPGFQSEINDMAARAQRGERLAGRFAAEVKAAERNAKLTEDQINKGALGLVLNADPDKAVSAVMSNPNRSGKLLDELIKVTEADPQARNGLKAAVREYLIDKVTSGASEKLKPGDARGPVSQARLSTVFKEHEKELARIYSPEEMNTLRAGHKALELANVERLRVSSGSDTAEKSAALIDQFLGTPVGKGVEAALRLKYGMLKAGGVISTSRRLWSNVTGGQDPVEVSRLIERAAVDPDLMGLLLGRKLPVGSPQWNAKLNRLMAYTAGARETDKK